MAKIQVLNYKRNVNVFQHGNPDVYDHILNTVGIGKYTKSLLLNFATIPVIPVSMTFTRSTVATCMAYAPTAIAGDLPLVTNCAINEARFNNARRISEGLWSPLLNDGSIIPLPITLLAEEARTNLLLNSATPTTQNVTVTAQAYTVSMWGTGTCTLSGTGSGTLTGTGAANRVSLTFTPTAGTLTLTFAGTNTNGQLEAAVNMSSFIPTVGAALTRTADVPSFTGTGLSWYNSQQGTFVIKASGQAFRNPSPFGAFNLTLPILGTYVLVYNNAKKNGSTYLYTLVGGSTPVEYTGITIPTTISLLQSGLENISVVTYYPIELPVANIIGMLT